MAEAAAAPAAVVDNGFESRKGKGKGAAGWEALIKDFVNVAEPIRGAKAWGATAEEAADAVMARAYMAEKLVQKKGKGVADITITDLKELIQKLNVEPEDPQKEEKESAAEMLVEELERAHKSEEDLRKVMPSAPEPVTPLARAHAVLAPALPRDLPQDVKATAELIVGYLYKGSWEALAGLQRPAGELTTEEAVRAARTLLHLVRPAPSAMAIEEIVLAPDNKVALLNEAGKEALRKGLAQRLEARALRVEFALLMTALVTTPAARTMREAALDAAGGFKDALTAEALVQKVSTERPRSCWQASAAPALRPRPTRPGRS